jgi:nicotinamidase/pyrazinamidase
MTDYSASTAVIVVDVQNDFADPNGSLFVSGAPDILPFINREIAAATWVGALIVRTQDWHPASTPHFAKDGGIWPDHCVADTWGAAFHPDLISSGPVIRKGVDGEDGYSGFTVRHPIEGHKTPTGLDDLLAENNITDIVVIGLATDYCVKETVIDALSHGYRCTVLTDGIRAVNLDPADGSRAIEQMEAAGATVTER